MEKEYATQETTWFSLTLNYVSLDNLTISPHVFLVNK